MSAGDLKEMLRDKGFTKVESEQAVRAMFEIMKEALQRGEPVETPVGVLQVEQVRKQRIGGLTKFRNFQGKTRYTLASRFPKRIITLKKRLEFHET